jgi:tRNA-dihydrouridine synthase A
MSTAPQPQPVITVAPMMAWTDRHCRYLLRQFSPQVRLFTEMVTAGALIHGPRERLLRFHAAEHPLAIQLGGAEPEDLARAAEMATEAGFDEINLNVGCPSDRVQRGRFGACLMREPDLVGDCIRSMRRATPLPVTVKCRLGVDDDDSQPLLERFVGTVADAGCELFYVHARKAILAGLSPAQNRQIPPLQHERVYALKTRFPTLAIHINGGIRTLDDAAAHAAHVDGLMIGREAYHRPFFLAELSEAYFGTRPVDQASVMGAFRRYVQGELEDGTRLHDMTRHCLGLFAGMPGARRYRRILSDSRRLKSGDVAIIDEALDALQPRAA